MPSWSHGRSCCGVANGDAITDECQSYHSFFFSSHCIVNLSLLSPSGSHFQGISFSIYLSLWMMIQWTYFRSFLGRLLFRYSSRLGILSTIDHGFFLLHSESLVAVNLFQICSLRPIFLEIISSSILLGDVTTTAIEVHSVLLHRL